MSDNKHISYAIKLLSVRDYFEEELFFKISKKFNNEKAKDAIETVKRYGYINDKKVAKNYIRIKLLSGYGPYYICNKLYAKGYNIDVDSVIAYAKEENIDMELYIKKIVTNYKNKKYNEPYEIWAKCMNYLVNRGYPTGLCKKLVKIGDFEK